MQSGRSYYRSELMGRLCAEATLKQKLECSKSHDNDCENHVPRGGNGNNRGPRAGNV